MIRFGMQRKVVFLLLGLVCTLQAQAGRPLTVDDANVNDVGEGHVEGWWTRAPNGSRSWTVAPAYAPIQNVELGAGIAREQKTGLETLNVQAKFRITESQENGCHIGAVLGAARTTGESSMGYVNALLTCNHPTLGSLHTNLGAGFCQQPTRRHLGVGLGACLWRHHRPCGGLWTTARQAHLGHGLAHEHPAQVAAGRQRGSPGGAKPGDTRDQMDVLKTAIPQPSPMGEGARVTIRLNNFSNAWVGG